MRIEVDNIRQSFAVDEDGKPREINILGEFASAERPGMHVVLYTTGEYDEEGSSMLVQAAMYEASNIELFEAGMAMGLRLLPLETEEEKLEAQRAIEAL